ncbi:ash family protein [Cedecea sp. NFIX57]|uniref:ash family protein n=1 Tax=Cedecea sp. NFIX57 TaxID=1566286 RepID=UPI000A0E77EE|nr:ash family protein [Cedecea sp. NFIX57]SMG37502.1 Ash protein family protein [Cedecea sp. NFIX57]
MHKLFLRRLRIRAYAFSASAKSGVGIGVPDMLSATHDAPASFLLSQHSHIQIMVGCVGASHEAPVSDNAGYANPAQLTTSEIGVSGGGIYSQLSEAATMATIPTRSPQYSRISSPEVRHA